MEGINAVHRHDTSMGPPEMLKSERGGDAQAADLHGAASMQEQEELPDHQPANEMAIVEVVSDVAVDEVTGATNLVVGDVPMNSVGVTAVVASEMTGSGVVTHVMTNGSPSSVRNDIGMTELATKEVLMSGVSMQKANWDTKMELYFVEALAEALRSGKASPSGFRKRELEEIRMMINSKFETVFTSRQVSSILQSSCITH